MTDRVEDACEHIHRAVHLLMKESMQDKSVVQAIVDLSRVLEKLEVEDLDDDEVVDDDDGEEGNA